MKTTLLTTAMAAFGLAFAPLHAADEEAGAAATTEASQAAETISTYVIQYSGGGWGIARRAGLALKTQEGVQTILLSGLRATVVMEDGKELDKEKTTKAFKAKGLPIKSFEKTETPMPAAAYQLVVAGTGWAETNEKVRVALEKVDGVQAAYVNNGISLHLESKDGYDKEKITAALKPFKLKIKEAKPIEGSPFEASPAKS